MDKINQEDIVNHPKHYTTGTIETIDYIVDKKFGYLDGQVVKYISRYRYKGKPIEDLLKCKWYLEKLIEETRRERG